MKLYFLRHADALDGIDDDQRPLSPEGKDECKVIGKFLKNLDIGFNTAYASPLVRTKETAEIVLSIVSNKTPLETVDALRNEASQKTFEQWLQNLKTSENLLFVGHAPTLAERAGKLLGLKNLSSVTLPKGGLICLETHDRHEARLVFFVYPKLLKNCN